ncbi:MAG: extracellular solute-binding protein [Patescibacteria group bacterium]
MKNKKKIAVLFLALLVMVSLSGCGCKKQTGVGYEIELEVWGLFDDRDAYAEVFENYTKEHPWVKKIEYKKLTPDTYQKDLVDALAAGQGPDIFLIHNSWLPNFKEKIVASPQDIVNEKTVRDQLVDTVTRDFVDNGQVYALPLSVNSLALFYNKDIFNRAGIATPPKTWEEFKEDVKMLTKVDQFGNITQSGAAMGTALNINRSTDILGLLIFQNQGEIVNQTSKRVELSGPKSRPAMEFYTQFSRSNSPEYSWNSRMHYSMDAFAEGNLAMMFNYSWQIPVLSSKAPKLNFAVAEVPQVNGNQKVTYANYWGLAVSKNKPKKSQASGSAVLSDEIRTKEAWQLIRYMALAPTPNPNVSGTFDPGVNYLEKTQNPAARRDLIEKQKTLVNIGVFASGNLYAKAWRQADPIAFESILATAIEQVVSGEKTVADSLRTAESQINNLIFGK